MAEKKGGKFRRKILGSDLFHHRTAKASLVRFASLFDVRNPIPQEKSAMKRTKGQMDQDVRAVRWLVKNLNDSETESFILAIPYSFEHEWGRKVWEGVVGDDWSTSQPFPGLPPPPREGITVYELCRRVQDFFYAYHNEGDTMDTKGRVEQQRRMRGWVETAASLVCCTRVELGLFGEDVNVLSKALSKVGDEELTNNPLTIVSNPLFSVRWTCLSLVAIKRMVNSYSLRELAKFALDDFEPFQTNIDHRNTVAMALTAAKEMDDDLKKAWEVVLDLRLALDPCSQNQNQTEFDVRSTLNNCEASIRELELIAWRTLGMEKIDRRIHLLQKRLEEVTHKLTRRLPGVFFHELPSTARNMTSKAFDLPSVQNTSIPPQLIFPKQQLQSMYILGQRLRDITERQNTERYEETLKYLREVPIPLCGLNNLMERQVWRLLDLRDGGGLGFTIELFFLSLGQLSFASPSPEESPSSDLKEVFYTGTFNVIKSNWTESKDSVGTRRILLEILCDLIIQGRGIFSDFRYPRSFVEMLLDLVGKMVEGLGQTGPHHIDDLLADLMDDSLSHLMNIGLRDEALSTINRSLYDVPAPEKPQSSPSQRTSIPDGTTSTPPPGSATTEGARTRSQLQDAAFSQRKGYPSPSSGGDGFNSQFPDRQEMHSRQYSSNRTAPMQLTRSISASSSTGATSGSQYAPTSSGGVRSNSHGSEALGPLPYRPLSSKERETLRQRRELGLGSHYAPSSSGGVSPPPRGPVSPVRSTGAGDSRRDQREVELGLGLTWTPTNIRVREWTPGGVNNTGSGGTGRSKSASTAHSGPTSPSFNGDSSIRQYRDSQAGGATVTSGSHYAPTSSGGVSPPPGSSSHDRSNSHGSRALGPGFAVGPLYRPMSSKQRDALRQREELGLDFAGAHDDGKGKVIQHIWKNSNIPKFDQI